jgi:hypothetical protein
MRRPRKTLGDRGAAECDNNGCAAISLKVDAGQTILGTGLAPNSENLNTAIKKDFDNETKTSRQFLLQPLPQAV